MSLRRQLLDALDPIGFHDGRIDLPTLWPAVKSWLLAPGDDERNFYLSEAPADEIMSFAGTPPAALAGRDLICIELGRELRTRSGSISTKVAAAGLVLWYADGPEWTPLSAEPGWIDSGPTTPHIDAFTPGDNASWLTTYIESSLAFSVACRQPTLAAVIADSVRDDLVVLRA